MTDAEKTERKEARACKARIRTRAWYAANREKAIADKKLYRQANLEKLQAREKTYREAHVEQKRISDKSYRESNLERIRAKHKAYSKANSEKINAKSKAYRNAYPERISDWNKAAYAANPKKFTARNNKYREAHPEKVQSRHKAYREGNPEKINAFARTRRARKFALTGHATPQQVQDRWLYYGGKCWMCGATATCTDHVKPLSKGGSDLAANLRPACTSCNSRKGSKWPYATAKAAFSRV